MKMLSLQMAALSTAIATMGYIAAAATAAEPIKPVAIYHFDVIAAAEGRLAQGSPNFIATHEGNVYFFEKPQGPGQFLTDPDRFLKAHNKQAAMAE